MNVLLITIKVKKLREEEYYHNQLLYYILDVKGEYSLLDIYINRDEKKVLYYFSCKKEELINSIKNELLTVIKEYKEVDCKMMD